MVRLRNLLQERLRRAGHERQLDVGPVLADGVVHDRPALQPRLLTRRFRQHQAVGGLPDRHLADVADEETPCAGAGGVQHHAPDVRVPAGCDDARYRPISSRRSLLADADVTSASSPDAAHRADVGDHRQRVHLLGAAVDGSRLSLHAQQPAVDDALPAIRTSDARAAERVVELQRVRPRAERHAQRAQPLVDGRHRVVVDRRDLAVVEIQRRQRLQHVVQLAAGELDGDLARCRSRCRRARSSRRRSCRE